MSNVLDLKHPEPAPEPVPEPLVAEPLVAEPVQVQSEERDAADELLVRSLDALAGPDPLEWEARHPLNDRSWYRHYMALAGFAFVGGAVAWWQSSAFTFVTILLGLAAWELHERLAKPVRVRVDERGVSVGGRHYPHTEFASFDLHQMADGTAELSLATRHWHSPLLRLPLGEQDPYAVRSALLHYVVEEQHSVPPVDWFIRRN